MATTLASQVQELYVGYLGRAADKAGLDFWVKAIESGTSTLESVALGFTLSEEYKAQYAGLTTTQLVAKVYKNVLGRDADADGLAFWAGEVNKGVIKADTLVKTMISSLGAIDQLTIDNKVTAANAYTTAAGDNYSIEAGKAAVQGASASAQTFTLTGGVDTADTAGSFRNGSNIEGSFKFTTGNETIVAANAAALGATDTLIDGSTADKDVLQLTLDASNPVGATITNIETFQVRATNAAAATLDLRNVTGLKTLEISGTPAGAITVVGTAGSATRLGDTGVTTVDASKVTSNVGLTVDSSTSVATANLTIIGTAIGANNLTGGLGNDTITGGSGNDTINGGAGNDTINAGDGTNTINAGTGNDTITSGSGVDTITLVAGTNTVSSGAGNDTITGGTGNDTIDAGAGNDTITVALGGNNTIKGGAGADTITLNTTTATAASVDTLVLEANAATNGLDIINSFVMGAAAAGGDVINASAFLGAAVSNYVEIASGVANNVATSNVVVVTDGTFAAAQVSGLVLKASSNILVVEDSGADATVSYVTTDANGTIVSNTAVMTLVGIAGAGIAAFEAAQFV